MKHIPNTSLALFRIFFGIMLFIEMIRYFAHGWIQTIFVEPEILFSYPGFGWVEPLPGPGMTVLFGALAVLAMFIAVGLLYRASAVLFFFGFSYVFLLEKTIYLNHFYLIVLLSFLMIFLPLNRSYSIDAKLWPKRASDSVPDWTLWLLRFQIAIPYVYGGFAKLNHDWLIRGEPMRSWLERASLPSTDGFVYFFAWGGTLFDLFIVPFLLWKKTRLAAFIVAVGFHLTNAFVFEIGIFPWFMIGATTLFFDPDWPRAVLKKAGVRMKDVTIKTQNQPVPAITRIGIGLFVSLQIIVPIRHHLIPGHGHWTEEGNRFAWNMRLNEKRGSVEFFVYDSDSSQSWVVDHNVHLAPHQQGHIVADPDVMWQFAQFVKQQFSTAGYPNVQVHANAEVSLNGRDPSLLTNPSVDLASEPRPHWHADWVTDRP